MRMRTASSLFHRCRPPKAQTIPQHGTFLFDDCSSCSEGEGKNARRCKSAYDHTFGKNIFIVGYCSFEVVLRVSTPLATSMNWHNACTASQLTPGVHSRLLAATCVLYYRRTRLLSARFALPCSA